MVIVNYEAFLKEKIAEEAAGCEDRTLKVALTSTEFALVVIRLYEYCQELNIIRRRIQKLKFTTDKNQLVMPKLIDSQIRRIDNKAREISTSYSLFLFRQRKFKVLSNESKYYEQLLNTIVKLAVTKCFNKDDSQHLAKEVNRLFRTNTFNSECCWKEYVEGGEEAVRSKSRSRTASTNFRAFRRKVISEKSQIEPYVNNKTCFKSLQSRSPLISLWHPNSEYLSFSLSRKGRARHS